MLERNTESNCQLVNTIVFFINKSFGFFHLNIQPVIYLNDHIEFIRNLMKNFISQTQLLTEEVDNLATAGCIPLVAFR